VVCDIQVLVVTFEYNVGVAVFSIKAKAVFQNDEIKIQNKAMIDNIFFIKIIF
jgi:hypothetical protein